jgi:predicted nucleic acid-binding protein
VWIDHFADRRTWATGELRTLLGHRTIATADLIVMELLQGVRSRRELRLLEDGLATLPCHNLGGVERARSAAFHYRLLRAQGMTPRSPIDVLIATFCIEEDFLLLASDRDFTLMAAHLDLALHKPPLN